MKQSLLHLGNFNGQILVGSILIIACLVSLMAMALSIFTSSDEKFNYLIERRMEAVGD